MVSNPYDPQQPTSPETFAGRIPLLKKATELIANAKAQRRNGAILIHGHRGSGKTSALWKIQSIAKEASPGTVVAEIPLRARSTEVTLLRDIVEEVKRSVAETSGSWARFRSVLSKVKAVNLGVMGTSLAVSGAPALDRPSVITYWRECLGALAGIPLLCICIDDAELLDKSGLGTLKTIAESRGPVPILLIVAGGPGLADRLSDPDSSPISRIFSGAVLDVGELTHSETKDALTAPLAAAKVGGNWTSDAVERIWRLSRGYPYMVKCLAYAAFREGMTLKGAEVDASVQSALDVASSWLEREIPGASDEDVRNFARIAHLGKTILSASEMVASGIHPMYTGRLVRLGVLKRTSRGRYEVRKAPVIAYYHLMKRDLSV